MIKHNILIACDQAYYDDWGEKLLKSVHDFNPWLDGQLHCHVVNPSKFQPLEYVNYTFEDITFENDISRVSYLQSSRFIQVANKIRPDNFFVTLDADTICRQSFTEENFSVLFEEINVLKHKKADRWLAGFVTFNDVQFAEEYQDLLMQLPIANWLYGRDQDILKILSTKYQFKSVDASWMHYGKNRHNTSVFFTLKGTQKNKDKYLKIYKKYQK